MDYIPVVNTALVELRMLLLGQKVENTLYVEKASALTGEDLENIASNTLAWWADQMAPLVPVAVSLVEVVATDLTTQSGGQSTQGGGGQTGERGGEILPNNVSLAVSFRTALRGRSFRGRNYLISITKDDRNGTNEIDPDYAASVVAAYTAYISAMSELDFTWVVVSRFSGGLPRAAGVTTPVTNVVIADLTLDSQRRRLPGRGA